MMTQTEKITALGAVPTSAGFKPVQADRQPKATAPSVVSESLQSGSDPESAPSELLLKVGQLQEKLIKTNYTLDIEVDPETGKNLVRVIDRETGEVLREIPAEEMLRAEASIQRMIGLFFDRQV
jgi:flagellar protein FlaG